MKKVSINLSVFVDGDETSELVFRFSGKDSEDLVVWFAVLKGLLFDSPAIATQEPEQSNEL